MVVQTYAPPNLNAPKVDYAILFSWVSRLIKFFHLPHHKFIGFMGSFQIYANFVNSWGLYNLNKNVMHYLNMEVTCMAFVCK
jgi:hypothetical protein